MPSHPDGSHGSHGSHNDTPPGPEFETEEERKARLAKKKGARRVLAVAGRQLSRERLRAIVEGRPPPRANVAEPLGPVPQASIPDTNQFLRDIAASEGQNVGPLISAFAALDLADANLASERLGKQRRRSRAMQAALVGGATTVARGVGSALFSGARRLGRIGKIRSTDKNLRSSRQ